MVICSPCYQSNQPNDVNIIEYLKKKIIKTSFRKIECNKEKDSNIHIFKANADTYYTMDNLLTIENDGKQETMKVSEWLNHNPVAFDMEKMIHGK